MAKIKISVIGNCQARPIATLLELLYCNVDITVTAIVHLISDEKEKDYIPFFCEADFIITQLVADNYPCKFLSTSRIKGEYGSKVITMPNLFYRGYTPDLRYVRIPGQGTLKGPLGDYHSEVILKSWLDGKSVTELHERMCSVEYWELMFGNVHKESLNELKVRESGLDVALASEIEMNKSKTRLFYTFNHPTLKLLILLVNKLAELIKLTSKTGSVVLPPEPLNQLVPPMSKFTSLQLDLPITSSPVYKGLMKQSESLYRGKAFYEPVEIYEEFYRHYDLNAELINEVVKA